MDSGARSGGLNRSSRWLLVHRVKGALGLAGMAALGVILVEVSAPSGPLGHESGGRDLEPEQVAESVPWRLWRDRLASAHAARRAGDVRAALDEYDAVAGASLARGQDVDHAALWSARLRLKLGECSAALNLRDLIMRCDDPALLSRALLVAESDSVRATCTGWSSTLEESTRLARAKLRALAAQETDEGQRAARWLRSLATKRR